MKKVMLLLAFVSTAFAANAQSKVGTIDAEYILSQMPEMVTVTDSLKAYGQKIQADMDSTIANYNTKVKDYQAKQADLSEEEQKSSQAEIRELEKDLQGFNQKASVMLQMKRNSLTEPLYEKINDAMIKVIEKEGFTQILHSSGNALAFSAEGYDITEKVLDALGIKPSPQKE